MIISKHRLENWDYVFILWFLTDALFNHTMIGTAGQAIFMLFSISKLINNHYTKKWPLIMTLYVIFCGICYLNIETGHSTYPGESRFLLNVLLRNALFFFCVINYVKTLDLEKLKDLFIFCCFWGSIAFLLLNYSMTGSIVLREQVGTENQGLNGNGQAVLNAMAICWMIATNMTRGRQNRIILIILLLFCVLAGTRKALLFFVLGVSVYYLLYNPSRIVKNVAKLGIIMVITYYILMSIPFVYDILGSRVESMLSFVQGGESDSSLDTRNHYIELGFEYFLQNPWYGHGINCFKFAPGAYGVYSHNNYIELLYSVGLPGTIAYYAMYLIILVRSSKKYFASFDKSVYALSIALILCLSMSDYGMVCYYERTTLLVLAILTYMSTYQFNNENQIS